MRKLVLFCLMFLSLATYSHGLEYQIVNLGPGQAFAINDAGQVTGNIASGNPYGGDAFLYSGGSNQVLCTGRGEAINASGQVVGDGGTFAFLYSNGSAQQIAPAGVGFGINDSGQVVGISTGNVYGLDNPNAFLYSGGSLQSITTNPSVALGINNSAQVVGYEYLNGSTSPTAFVYSNGVFQTLGLGIAYSINQNGQVVGVNSSRNVFLYSNGSFQTLGPGGAQINVDAQTLYGINDSGQVVGQNSSGDAFLYSNGSMYDLNSLVVSNSGWTLNEAAGINDSGQIVGWGNGPSGDYDAFLLNPIGVPEPTTIALVLCGIALFLPRLRKR